MQSSLSNLASPLTVLNGVGPALAEKLKRLNLDRVEDLLFLLPLRYEDRTQLIRIGALQAGERCLVSGEVLLAETVYRGRRNLLVRIADGSGQITLRFFHFSRQQQAQFKVGFNVTCFGEARKGSSGLEMIHPEYRVLRKDQDAAINETLTPIYPATEGAQQGRLRNLTDQALRMMHAQPPDELLPANVRRKLGLPALVEAIDYLHRPPPDADVAQLLDGTHPCQQRLAFEELLAHYMSLRSLRDLARTETAQALTRGDREIGKFVESLAFELTTAQQRVINEITADMAQPNPMMRLVQGDVGSGKTVVAAIACLKAISCGVQAAIMAPTELLAEQHWRSFREWFRELGIEPAWLSGSQRTVARREALESIADGSAQLIVGTHALFQEGVTFNNLALVVIDEQHRFGVHQRVALREKGVSNCGIPHQLVMTATPIPRTLAMAAYADLDTSVIDELPPGRKPVSTIAVPDTRRDEIVARVRTACQSGQQAFWVCPLIEESEILDFEAAESGQTQKAC
jgi:ATP-dependent DNA helicase RecG